MSRPAPHGKTCPETTQEIDLRGFFVLMRLSIFSRLTLGYLAMFVVIGGMNAFVLMKLDTLNADTARIINIDQRLLDLRKRLADSLLIQMGFEKKYAITGDPTFKQRFSSASDDFTGLLTDALETADLPDQRDALLKVRTVYTTYHSIVRQETEQTSKIRTVVERPGAQEWASSLTPC
jgi:two-component system, NtrC family, sensor histidine kinase GlrK